MAIHLIRFAEAGRDAQAERRGVRRDLVAEIARNLPGARIAAENGRIVVECETDAAPILAALPGVTSFSPCRRVPLSQLVPAAVAMAAEALPPGGSFAVRIKRVGQHRFRSRELASQLGRAVAQAVPGARVDLDAPDLQLGVEVRGDQCFLFRDVVAGADRAPQPGLAAGEPRFLADQMLGRLAVWLRLLGFDTSEALHRPDSWLLREARDQGRVLLTRDRALSLAGSAATRFVEARDVHGQLAEVIRAFELRFDRARLLSRCTRCNRAIEEVSPEQVAGRVPPPVRERQHRFFRCPSCDRIYWEGDHCARILSRLATLFPPGVMA
ncbi:MAG TPA: Mut7-C RNAse domain-containing protein [Kofleriaceae bacterium]|nr:Mut7-C RNAse domain-containing protein [Kofleriaceae bacterium]